MVNMLWPLGKKVGEVTAPPSGIVPRSQPTRGRGVENALDPAAHP